MEKWRDPLIKSFSRSGLFHGQRLQPAKKRTIVLKFVTLSNSERSTIEAHYDANRTLTFNYTWQDANGAGTYTWAAGVVTVISAGHGLLTGASVAITFISGAGTPNGNYAITVVDANTFTFALAGSGAGGNLTWVLAPFVVAYGDDNGIEWTKASPGRWDATITLEMV
jgi:hypothetical protein